MNQSLVSSDTTSHQNASSTSHLVSTTSKSITSSSLPPISSPVLYTGQRDADDLRLEVQSEHHRAPCHQPFLKDALPAGRPTLLNASSNDSSISQESSTRNTSSSSSCVSVLKDQRTSNPAFPQEKPFSSPSHQHTVARDKAAISQSSIFPRPPSLHRSHARPSEGHDEGFADRSQSFMNFVPRTDSSVQAGLKWKSSPRDKATEEYPGERTRASQHQCLPPQKAGPTGVMSPNFHMTQGNVETKQAHRQQSSSFLVDTSLSKSSSFAPPPVSIPSSFSTSSAISRANVCHYPPHPRGSESANPPRETSQTTRSARPSFIPPVSLGSSSLSSSAPVNTADKPAWTASSSFSSSKSFAPAATKNSTSMLTRHSDSLLPRVSSLSLSFNSQLGNNQASGTSLDKSHPEHHTSVGKLNEDQNARGAEEQGLPFFTPLLRLPPINLASRGGGLTARHQLASLLPVRFAIPQDPQKVGELISMCLS